MICDIYIRVCVCVCHIFFIHSSLNRRLDYFPILTIALISHASKVMLKILQARFQQYMNHELSDVQAGFRKGTGTRDQIANIC